MEVAVLELGGKNLEQVTLTLSNVSSSLHKNMATDQSDPLSKGTELSSMLHLAELGLHLVLGV